MKIWVKIFVLIRWLIVSHSVFLSLSRYYCAVSVAFLGKECKKDDRNNQFHFETFFFFRSLLPMLKMIKRQSLFLSMYGKIDIYARMPTWRLLEYRYGSWNCIRYSSSTMYDPLGLSGIFHHQLFTKLEKIIDWIFILQKKKKKKFLITNQQTKNAQSNKHKSKNIYMKISTRNVYKFSLVFFLFFSGKNVLYIIITMNGFLVTKHHAIDFLFNKHQRLMASETLAEELNDSWDKSFVCVEKWKWSVGSDWCYFFKCKQINSKKKRNDCLHCECVYCVWRHEMRRHMNFIIFIPCSCYFHF